METPTKFTCRLCGDRHTREEDVVEIFSEYGKKSHIAAKAFFTLSLLICENDSGSKYICTICIKHINFYVMYSAKCRVTNINYINTLKKSPNKEEFNKTMNLSIQSVYFNKHHLDVAGIYNSLLTYMKSSEGNHTYFDELVLANCNNQNSITNSIFSVNNNLGITVANSGTPIRPNSSVPTEVHPTSNNVNQNKEDNPKPGTGKNVSNNQNGIKIDMTKTNKQKQSTSQNQTTVTTNSKNINNMGPNSNGLIVRNTNNDHDYIIPNNSKSSVNKVIDIDEIICLDDDSDDYDDIAEDDVHPLNQWVITNNNVKHNRKTYPPKASLQKKSPLNIQFNRRLVPFNHNVQSARSPVTTKSTDISSEFVTVTPDITLPSTSMDSITDRNQSSHLYYVIPTQPSIREEPTESSLVTPETGFHFLFSTESETVDLTNEYHNQQNFSKNKRKTKIIDHKSVSKKICSQTPTNQQPPSSPSRPPPRQQPPSSPSRPPLRQQPSRQPPSLKPPSLQPPSLKPPYLKPPSLKPQPQQLLSKQSNSRKTILLDKSVEKVPISRSNRSSTFVAVNRVSQNSSLWKLGIHKDTCNWKVLLSSITVPLYQCPICSKTFHDIGLRETHEKNEHCFPPEPTGPSVDSITTLENATSNDQQEFLIYLNLVKRLSLKTQVTDQLANRTHLLKSLKKFGNIIGSYNCHFCEYKTSRVFILWAHMSYNHVKLDSDKKSNTFCFLCDRILSKRTSLLKHLDKCAMKPIQDEKSADEKLTCNYCDEKISSLSHLETHLWDHVPT